MKRILGLCTLVVALNYLARGDVVTGKVIDPDGKPVADATVIVQHFAPRAATENSTLKTDDAGKFIVEMEPHEPGGEIYGRAIVSAQVFAPSGGALRKGENVWKLSRPAVVRGHIIDEKGAPIADAKVSVNMFIWNERKPFEQRNYVWIGDTALGGKYSAVSDTDGKWQIDNVPADAKIDIEVRDPRYVAVRKSVYPTDEATWKLRSGANITGRVVYEDGRAASNVRIMAQPEGHGGGWSEAKSDGDGRFELQSLPTGSYNVLVDAPEGFVAAAAEGATATEGQTKAIADLILATGALVTGRVTDDKGAPLPGLYIGSYGPHRPQSSGAVINDVTDTDGNFKLRVAPGENYVYPQSTPTGFLRREGTTFKIKAGETKAVNFVFDRGLQVKGTAIDMSGKPLSKIRLRFASSQSGGYVEPIQVTTDADGNWSLTGFTEGEWKASAVDEKWKVLLPQKFSVPSAQPIQIALGLDPREDVKGRVVDVKGAPLQDVALKFQVLVPQGGGRLDNEERSAISDANGEFAVKGFYLDDLVSLVSAEKDGFALQSGGRAVREGKSWKIEPIVLAPFSGKISGRVVDDNGKPVRGAKVLAGETAESLTDNDGRFAFEKLPAAKIVIVAAHGQSAAMQEADASGEKTLELALRPMTTALPQDKARAIALLAEVWQEAEGKEYFARASVGAELGRLDPTRPLAQMEGRPKNLVYEIARLARREPAKTLEYADRLDEIVEPQERAYAAAQIGIAAADVDKTLAEEMFVRARDAGDGKGQWGLMRLVSLAQLASKLELPDARQWTDVALAAAREEAKKNPDLPGYEATVAEALAEVSTAEAEYVIAQLNGEEQSNAYQRVVPILARRDPAVALRMLGKIEQTLGQDSRFVWSGAAVSIVRSLGKTDPKVALELARRVTDDYYRPAALLTAARFQDDALAQELLREASGAAMNHQDPLGELTTIASSIWTRYPALAREIYARALNLAQKRETDDDGNFRQRGNVSTFAFGYARVDRAASRILLEREWIKQLKATQTGDNENGWALSSVATAMAAVDFERALEMARAIPIKTIGGKQEVNAHFDARRKLAQYLLLSAEQRSTLRFGRWNASDTWNPAESDEADFGPM